MRVWLGLPVRLPPVVQYPFLVTASTSSTDAFFSFPIIRRTASAPGRMSIHFMLLSVEFALVVHDVAAWSEPAEGRVLVGIVATAQQLKAMIPCTDPWVCLCVSKRICMYVCVYVCM